MLKPAHKPRSASLLLLAACTLAVWLVPSLASAQVELEFTELRSAELPVPANGAQLTSTDDGRTVVANTTGAPEDPACTVVVIEADGATSFEYQNGPTACVGLLPHPDGGFFLRTIDPTADPDADPPIPAGATVRIDADGNEVWALDDQTLVDALPESENGPGEFLGQYGGPVPLMAYSSEFDKLLGFTNGILSIGGGSRLAQAHVVNADDGELRESGQTFGEDAGGRLAALTTRESDGYFVLAIFRAGTNGANFYSYNGRSNIDFFRPVGEQWDERNVEGITYDPQSNFYIMWLEGEGEDATTHLTAAGSDESLLWSESYAPDVVVDGSEINIGEPLGFWVGSRYAVLLHRKGSTLLLRVVDILDGADLGVSVLEPPSGYAPLTILNGEQQRLKLVSYDEQNNRVVEYEIGVSESDGGGEDAGGADAGSSDSDGGDGGCGCASADADSSPLGSVLFALVGLFGLRLRRA
ncbi:MAG: MYXO-CTERM sorting domain-containing protein [Myxococcota bacterium]